MSGSSAGVLGCDSSSERAPGQSKTSEQGPHYGLIPQSRGRLAPGRKSPPSNVRPQNKYLNGPVKAITGLASSSLCRRTGNWHALRKRVSSLGLPGAVIKSRLLVLLALPDARQLRKPAAIHAKPRRSHTGINGRLHVCIRGDILAGSLGNATPQSAG